MTGGSSGYSDNILTVEIRLLPDNAGEFSEAFSNKASITT